MGSLINISSITSFEDVLRQLKLLEKDLNTYNLSQFSVFNTAYTIVTNAIKDAAADDYFQKPDFIEKFTICFASYYFQVINNFTSGSPDIPQAWVKMRDAAQTNSTPMFIVLLMGANAHINHDLPLAMATFVSKNRDYSLRDARRVDKVLMKSGKQIIPAFVEPNLVLNRLKDRFKPIYYRPVMYMILAWRIVAWRNHQMIIRGALTKDTHVRRSTVIANRLWKLGKLAKSPQ